MEWFDQCVGVLWESFDEGVNDVSFEWMYECGGHAIDGLCVPKGGTARCPEEDDDD